MIPNIGDIKLKKLTSLDIQKIYNRIKTSGRVHRYPGMKDFTLSNYMVRGIHMVLHNCLEQAVKEHLLASNPADGCKIPPKDKTEMKVIPPEQIGAYLREAKTHGVLAMFYLELTSGLRRGELLALLWSDLDVEKRTISVTKSVSRIRGVLKVSGLKTQNSVRTIVLPQHTVELLKQGHDQHHDNPYMFPSPVTGGMYGPDCVGRIHQKLLKRAGIEHIRFHDLRHTYTRRWPCKTAWMSRRSPVSWGTTPQGLRSTHTPASPPGCSRMRRTGWGISCPARPGDIR